MKAQWRLGYFTAVALLGTSLLGTPVQAQVGAERSYRPAKDHLQCFDIHLNEYSEDTVLVELKTEFGEEECHVTVSPAFLCAEAAKEHEDDAAASTYRGYDAGDFLCHAVACEKDDYDKYRSNKVTIEDQFGKFRKVEIKDSNYLCAPAEIKKSRR